MPSATTTQEYTERLAGALPRIRDEIAKAAVVSGRGASDVRLVAVTKGHPVEALRAALAHGLTDLGENRVGELASKVETLGREGICWHMIGHVQRRKVPELLGCVDLVHSVDSMRLAERIGRLVSERGTRLDVLVQVNTSGEAVKGGFGGEAAVDEILAVAGVSGLRVCGLMTMAPFVADEAVLRATFGSLRDLLAELRRQNPAIGPDLSMGMTNDLRFAVEEGSTIVRIGTALFGPRSGGRPEA